MRGQERKPHDARSMAESFGADPARYDRLRPSYPSAMIERIVEAAPGPEMLEVGCGTGIASRLFQESGCNVLGVEVDPRMAAFAREYGLEVEVAKFEEWDRAGRTFDALVSGTTWHWIDPVAGAQRAAEAIRPGGLFAAFWNVQHPPQPLAESFSAAHAEVAPSSLFARQGAAAHHRITNRTSRGLSDTGAFDTPRTRSFRWEQHYTRDEWLDVASTFGGHSMLSPAQLDQLTTSIGAAIDAEGGSFTMEYETQLVTAVRCSR